MFYFLNNVRLYKDVRNVNLITSNCFQYEVYQIRLKQFARLTNLIDSFMILVEARQLRWRTPLLLSTRILCKHVRLPAREVIALIIRRLKPGNIRVHVYSDSIMNILSYIHEKEPLLNWNLWLFEEVGLYHLKICLMLWNPKPVCSRCGIRRSKYWHPEYGFKYPGIQKVNSGLRLCYIMLYSTVN